MGVENSESLSRRRHIVWCIQQFDSRLSDVSVYLLSRLPTSVPTARKKVSVLLRIYN